MKNTIFWKPASKKVIIGSCLITIIFITGILFATSQVQGAKTERFIAYAEEESPSYEKEGDQGALHAYYKNELIMIIFPLKTVKVFYQGQEVKTNLDQFLEKNVVKGTVLEAEGAWQGKSFMAKKVYVSPGQPSR